MFLSSRILRSSLLLALLLLPIALYAQTKPFLLLQLTNDGQGHYPRNDVPYLIQLDGVFEAGRSDRQGHINTVRRKQGADQEFFVWIYSLGYYHFFIDAKNKVHWVQLDSYTLNDWGYPCFPDENTKCDGQGFYGIQLYGAKETHFQSEPYVLRAGSRTYQGNVDEKGTIFIHQNDPAEKSEPMELTLCAGPVIRIVSGIQLTDSSVTQQKISEQSVQRPVHCENSTLEKYSKEYHNINHGIPFIYTHWARGLPPMEATQQEEQEKQAEKQALLDAYHQAVVANNDPLAWLGPLPDSWSEEKFETRVEALHDKIKKDIDTGLPSLQTTGFSCKTPTSVGPIPDMDAVDAYLLNFPKSIDDQKIVDALYAAAAKGNWLAIAQVYVLEDQRPSTDNPYVHNYRMLQLMEWLQAHKIGAIYREIGKKLAATGYYSDQPGGAGITAFYIYAAFHNSYPAMYEVGKSMFNNAEDEETRALGKSMVDCARAASPGYAKEYAPVDTAAPGQP